MLYFVNFIEVKSKNAVVWDFKPRLGQASRYNILRYFSLSQTDIACGRQDKFKILRRLWFMRRACVKFALGRALGKFGINLTKRLNLSLK